MKRVYRNENQDPSVTSSNFVNTKNEPESQLRLSKLQVETDEIKSKMDRLRHEMAIKDEYLKGVLKEEQKENQKILEHINHIQKLEQIIKSQSHAVGKHNEAVLEQIQKNATIRDKFANTLEEYNNVKIEIPESQMRQKELSIKSENCKERLMKVQKEHALLEKELGEVKIEGEEQTTADPQISELAKLESLVKGLEMKTTFLEREMKQKIEEYENLAALHKDLSN